MKKSDKYFLTESQANKICEGIYNRKFSDWYKLDGNMYAPIGADNGLELCKNREIYFHELTIKKKFPVAMVEFATMDEKSYFLRVTFIDYRNMFIPIVGENYGRE